LLAQGLSEEAARSTIRISFGRFTTQQETAEAVAAVHEVVDELRAVAAIA